MLAEAKMAPTDEAVILNGLLDRTDARVAQFDPESLSVIIFPTFVNSGHL